MIETRMPINGDLVKVHFDFHIKEPFKEQYGIIVQSCDDFGLYLPEVLFWKVFYNMKIVSLSSDQIRVLTNDHFR